MRYNRDETGKTRFYIPFILAFLVFSAVLSTEYFIVVQMLEDAYESQAAGYHAVSERLQAGLEAFSPEAAVSHEEAVRVLQALAASTGIDGLSVRIVPDDDIINGYQDLPLAGGGSMEGVDLENRVIETSIAKTTIGGYLILEAIDYNTEQIKYLHDISVALIIILVVMVIFAVVPGVLMIESLTRRRRMTGSVLSPSGAGGWEAMSRIFSGSRVTGCMVISPGNEILWANGTCREMLEMERDGTGFSLASVTSLPEAVRLKNPPYSTEPETELVRIRTMTGETRLLLMETLPVLRGGEVNSRIIILTSQPGEDGTHTGMAAGKGDSSEAGSPAVVQIMESILHDMKNHLSGIIGSASIEIDRREETQGSADGWSAVLGSAEKMTALCGDLQSMLTGEEDQVLRDPFEEINLIAEVMRRILPEKVRFLVSGSSEKLVSLRRDLFRDLLYNLSLNSTEMMNGEGRIQVDISERIPTGVNTIGNVPPGNVVCIRYSDGYIMPVALRDILSSRRYPVADVERQFGTTVGSLYRVLREIDGKIAFERGSGETVLCILLDGQDRPLTQGRKPSEQSEYSEVSGLSVLVAEAVDIVLQTTCEYLEHRGMVTTGVSSGDRAMELLRSGRYDAAVLDLNMPGTPTASIVRYCQTSLPSMAVVITTGYGMNDQIRELIKIPSTDCLYKPHRPEVLVETIYSTLMRIQEGDQT